uniref:Uncharacterized protein n=1 Tax=Denticeps clupeoides TaxID=299321 RepID=A0AAY3ZVS3_9TELE
MTGSLGSSLIITCKYPKESENNCKSFCKGRRGECASKISGRTRNQWERRGRFSLYNNSTGRFFMVTIDQLRPEDPLRYWDILVRRGFGLGVGGLQVTDYEGSPYSDRSVVFVLFSAILHNPGKNYCDTMSLY